MRGYGYAIGENDLLELVEVTIQGSPTALRNLARFILDCADRMEVDEGWEHEHFQTSPFATAVDSTVDVVVFRAAL